MKVDLFLNYYLAIILNLIFTLVYVVSEEIQYLIHKKEIVVKNAALRLTGIVLIFYAMSTVTADKKQDDVGQKKISQNWLLLQDAIQNGSYQTVAHVAKECDNLALFDKNGDTLLHMASRYCWSLPEGVGASMVRSLIDAKADVHAKNNKGCTPLHVYCESHSSCCRPTLHVLLEKGATVSDDLVKVAQKKVGWGGSTRVVTFLTEYLKAGK